MARKRQTTGLPKTNKSQKNTDEGTQTRRGVQREYRSRAEREAEIQRLVILGVAVAIGLVFIILAIAFVVDQVINPSRTVATVNGDGISVSEFEERVRLERVISIQRLNDGINDFLDFGFTTDPNEAFNQLLQNNPAANTIWNELNVPDQIGLRVLDDMINDALIRAEAEELGITVSEEDVQREIDELFGFDRELVITNAEEAESTPGPEATAEETATLTPTPFVSPTPTSEPSITPTPAITATASLTPFPTIAPTQTRTVEEQIENIEDRADDLFSQIRSATGMSNDDINRYFESRAIRRALSTEVTEVGDMDDFVNARHILVQTEEEALDVIAALNNGESFAALAQTVSQDTGSGANGGELGWSPALNYVDEFETAVREATIGEITEPIETDFGFHVIQVRAREDRELTEAQIENERATRFEDWVQELRQSEDTDFEIDPIWTSNVPGDPPFVYRSR